MMLCLGLGQPTRCSAAMRTPQIPNHYLVARRPVSWPPPRSAPSARRGELLQGVVVRDAGFPGSPGARRTATGKPPRRNRGPLAKTLAVEIVNSRDSPRAASNSTIIGELKVRELAVVEALSTARLAFARARRDHLLARFSSRAAVVRAPAKAPAHRRFRRRAPPPLLASAPLAAKPSAAAPRARATRPTAPWPWPSRARC